MRRDSKCHASATGFPELLRAGSKGMGHCAQSLLGTS